MGALTILWSFGVAVSLSWMLWSRVKAMPRERPPLVAVVIFALLWPIVAVLIAIEMGLRAWPRRAA